MKEKDTNEEEIDSEKPTNINELLEPLVDENKNKAKNKNNLKNIFKSVKVPNNDYEPPNPKNNFLHNSISVNRLNNSNNNPINRIRKEINDLKKDNETEI